MLECFIPKDATCNLGHQGNIRPLELEIQERVVALGKERKCRENKEPERDGCLPGLYLAAPVEAAELPERKQGRHGHENDARGREDFGRKDSIGTAHRHKPEHRFPHAPRLADVIGAEQHPAKQHNHLRNQDLHHAGRLVVERVLVVRTLHNHEEGMVQAPANERPVRTVPYTAQEHDHEQIKVQTFLAHAVTAEGDVEVIAEPARERNVPALPEFGNAPRAVRAVEVAREMEPEHQAETDCHIRIRREVEVNLEHVGKATPPAIQHAGGVRRKHAVGDDAHLVREENLFGESEAEEHDAAHEVLERMRACRQLLGHRIVTYNRARHKLREQRHVTGERHEVLDRRGGTAPHVNRVAHGLERIERDAYRQQHRHHRERLAAELGHHIVDDAHAEHVVLEESERTEVHDNRRKERQIALPLASSRRRDEPPAHVNHERRAEHQEYEPRFEPAVKDVTENRDEEVQAGMLDPSTEQHKVADQERRQKIEQENLGREDHGLLVHFNRQVARGFVVKVFVFNSSVPVALERHNLERVLGLRLELAHVALALVGHLVLDLAAGNERVIDTHEDFLGVELAGDDLLHLVLEHVHVAVQVVARHLARDFGQAGFNSDGISRERESRSRENSDKKFLEHTLNIKKS